MDTHNTNKVTSALLVFEKMVFLKEGHNFSPSEIPKDFRKKMMLSSLSVKDYLDIQVDAFAHYCFNDFGFSVFIYSIIVNNL